MYTNNVFLNGQIKSDVHSSHSVCGHMYPVCCRLQIPFICVYPMLVLCRMHTHDFQRFNIDVLPHSVSSTSHSLINDSFDYGIVGQQGTLYAYVITPISCYSQCILELHVPCIAFNGYCCAHNLQLSITFTYIYELLRIHNDKH